MAQKYTTISKDGISYLCSCIKQLASVSEAINNTNLADDKVFSNLYTKKLIDKCLEDANTEAQKLVGALTYLTCEETTVQPTLDNSSINVIYLYSATGNAPYQQYLKINETELIDMGSTTSFNDLVTSVEKKIDKDKIVTVLDDTVTDEQVASALLIKTELDKTNAKLTQLETKQINKLNLSIMSSKRSCLKITPSTADNFSKILMTDLYGGCVLITGSTVTDYNSFKVVRLSNGDWSSYSPNTTTRNKIVDVYYDGSFIYVTFENYSKIYIEGGFITTEKIDSIPTGVTQLPILDLTQGVGDLTAINSKLTQLENTINKVNDVPKTTLTPVFPNGVTVGSSGATINYVVKNGWCNVDFVFNISRATALTWNDIATGLPKPANNVNIVLINDGGKTYRPIPIKINSNGSVSSRIPFESTANDWWAGNISYPVAE